MDIRLMLVELCLFYLVSAKDMKYFSNFKLGPLQVGRESVVKDFVTIENDPVSNLPNEFTICTSLFIDIVKSSQYLFEILKKDGTHWFSIAHATRSATTNDELFFCYQTGKYLFLKYTLKLNLFVLKALNSRGLASHLFIRHSTKTDTSRPSRFLVTD